MGELGTAPSGPGAYAWYYRPELTRFDVDEVARVIRELPGDGSKKTDAAEVVRHLLERRLFHYFREGPYRATLSGQLKARYSGELNHEVQISESLIERLAEAPERLHSIREVLADTAPLLASPLYIGMSDRLRARLEQHRNVD